jgi:hypothetical protein
MNSFYLTINLFDIYFSFQARYVTIERVQSLQWFAVRPVVLINTS